MIRTLFILHRHEQMQLHWLGLAVVFQASPTSCLQALISTTRGGYCRIPSAISKYILKRKETNVLQE